MSTIPLGHPEQFPLEVRDRLQTLTNSGTSHLIVIRCPDRELGTALLNGIVRDRPGPGVIVTSPNGWVGGAYPDPFSARPELWFKALPVSDEVVSIAAASAVMRFVLTLMRDPETNPVALPLWLPPRLLKAYGMLPTDPIPTIGVDSWDDLLAIELREPSSVPLRSSAQEDQERLLLRAIEELVGVHFVVVTRRRRADLEATADLVLEAVAAGGESPESVILRVLEPPGGSWTIRRPVRDSPLVRSAADAPVRCRCGTVVPLGGDVYTLTTGPALAWATFHDHRFCSPRCARGHVLEVVEELDSIDTATARATVSDLREVLRELDRILGALLES